MRKFLLLGLLGIFLLSVNAAPRRSAEDAVRLEKTGKARVFDSKSSHPLKKKGKKSMRPRTDIQHSGVRPFKASNAFQPQSGPKALRQHDSKRRAEGMEGIYGYLSYDYNYEDPYGMYRLDDESYELMWEDPVADEWGLQATNGWLIDGKIYGTVLDTDGYMLYDYGYFVIDFETGELEDFDYIELYETDVYIYMSTYNPDDGRIYGYAYYWPEGGYAEIYWISADFDDLTDAEAIKYAEDDYCYSLCYNAAEQCFYGININQEFVKIDLEGNQTFVADVPEADYMDSYITGLVWDPSTNLFFWNYNDIDGEAGLFSITPGGDFDYITDYPSGQEFTYFVTTNEYVASGRPQTPTVESNSFEGPSLSGSVTFAIPSEYGDGQPLPEEVDYVALLDGKEYASGTVETDSSLEVDFEVEESGFHVFGLYIVADGDESGVASVKLYVGNDTPMAPADVTLTTTEISWKAVTQGVNGGYVDPSKISYNVYLNDSMLGTTTGTSYAITLPEDAPLTSNEAAVVAVFDGRESKPGLSNRLLAGASYTVPMYLEPTEREYDTMTVFDANGDGVTWKYDKDNTAVKVSYSAPDESMDDYLFLPPIKINSTDDFYSVSLQSTLCSFAYTHEYISVEYATAPNPNAIKGTIIDTYTPTYMYKEEEWDVTEGLWHVDEPGVYYIAIHCTSEGDMFGVAVRDFKVETTSVTLDSPEAVENLKAVAAEEGALNATVSFTFPTQTLQGGTLAADLDLSAVVTVSTTTDTYTVTGKPGSDASVEVTTVQGNNTVTVEVRNGEQASPAESVEVYTGISTPATPQNLEAEVAPDMMSVLITWDAVTTSATEGGYVNPATVTYSIYQYVDYGMFQDWEPVATDIETNSYLLTLPEGTPQDIHVYGVTSSNEAGSNGYIGVLNNIYLGEAFNLPMQLEIDSDGKITPSPWITYKSLEGETYSAGWFLDYLNFYIPEAEEEPAMVGFAQGALPCKGALGAPRFKTTGCSKVKITLYHAQGLDKCPFSLWGMKYGDSKMVKIGEYAASEASPAMGESEFTLPDELLNQDWVQVYIFPEFNTARDIFLLRGCNIQALSSSVAAFEGEAAVKAIPGAIIVKGLEGSNVTISTIDGITMTSGTAASAEEVYPVAPGIYIVKAGDITRKLIVR